MTLRRRTRPMTPEEAREHAQRQLEQAAPFLSRKHVKSDQEAFKRIKARVHTPDLAQEILDKGFEQVESLDAHRPKE